MIQKCTEAAQIALVTAEDDPVRSKHGQMIGTGFLLSSTERHEGLRLLQNLSSL